MSRIWKKTPDDTENFTITWRGNDPNIQYALEDSESIVTSVWTLPAGLVEDASANTTTTTTLLVSGGTLNERYKVTNVVTLDSGRILSRSVYLHIVELWVN